jgi:hypothetical protein
MATKFTLLSDQEIVMTRVFDALRELVQPERLADSSEFEGMPGHLLIETVTFEEHDGMLKSGMEERAAETSDRLAGHLAKG